MPFWKGALQRSIGRITGDGFVRSVTVLAGGTAFGQLIVIAASPVLTRLYSPDDFGVLGVFVSLSGILSVAATLRYEMAVPLPREDDDAAGLVVLSLTVIPFMAGGFSFLVWATSDRFALWAETPGLAAHLWLLPVSVALTGVWAVFNNWAIRKRAFGAIARTKLTQGAAVVLTQFALFPAGPVGLLLGQVVGTAVGGATITAMSLAAGRGALRNGGIGAIGRLASRYRRFPFMSTPSGILYVAGTQLPVVFLAGLYGPFVAGQFALVQRAVAWPIVLVGHSVTHVYFGEGAAALRTSPTAFRRLFFRATWGLAAVALPLTCLLLVAAPRLFPVVFGAQWETAGDFARLVAPMAAGQLIALPLSRTLDVLERQSWQLGVNVFQLGGVAAGFWLAHRLDWSPARAVAAYSAAMTCGYLAAWLMQLLCIKLHAAADARGRAGAVIAGAAK